MPPYISDLYFFLNQYLITCMPGLKGEKNLLPGCSCSFLKPSTQVYVLKGKEISMRNRLFFSPPKLGLAWHRRCEITLPKNIRFLLLPNHFVSHICGIWNCNLHCFWGLFPKTSGNVTALALAKQVWAQERKHSFRRNLTHSQNYLFSESPLTNPNGLNVGFQFLRELKSL